MIVTPFKVCNNCSQPWQREYLLLAFLEIVYHSMSKVVWKLIGVLVEFLTLLLSGNVSVQLICKKVMNYTKLQIVDVIVEFLVLLFPVRFQCIIRYYYTGSELQSVTPWLAVLFFPNPDLTIKQPGQ